MGVRASLLDIKEILGENSLDLKFLQEFVSSALLDPSEDVRRNAIKILEDTYHGIIKRGFSVANQLFIVVDCEDMPFLSYIGDVPYKYSHNPAVSFCI
jgi:hypothetical protein